jgi:hypothetical protein
MHSDPIPRWTTFVERVEGRLTTVLAEWAQTLADVTALDPLDEGPVASLESALQSRINRLDDRIDEAWEVVADDLDDHPQEPTLRQTKRDLKARVWLDSTQQKTRRLGELGRTLQRLAHEEDGTRTCSSCAAPLPPTVLHQALNLACTGCGAVNAVRPGRAADAWFQRGVSYVANDEALEAWIAMHNAEHALESLRHPSMVEYEAFEQAAETYWGRWYQAHIRHHPAWTQDQADAETRGVIAKLRFRHHDAYAERLRTIADGLAQAQRGSPAQLQRWAHATHPDELSLLDDLLDAAVERGQRPAATTLVKLVHADEMPWWFGRQRWLRSKLTELSTGLA